MNHINIKILFLSSICLALGCENRSSQLTSGQTNKGLRIEKTKDEVKYYKSAVYLTSETASEDFDDFVRVELALPQGESQINHLGKSCWCLDLVVDSKVVNIGSTASLHGNVANVGIRLPTSRDSATQNLTLKDTAGGRHVVVWEYSVLPDLELSSPITSVEYRSDQNEYAETIEVLLRGRTEKAVNAPPICNSTSPLSISVDAVGEISQRNGLFEKVFEIAFSLDRSAFRENSFSYEIDIEGNQPGQLAKHRITGQKVDGFDLVQNIDFGPVFVGKTKQKAVRIASNSGGPFSIHQLNISNGAFFSWEFDNTQSKEHWLNITFAPETAAEVKETAVVELEDGTQLSFDIQARGFERPGK